MTEVLWVPRLGFGVAGHGEFSGEWRKKFSRRVRRERGDFGVSLLNEDSGFGCQVSVVGSGLEYPPGVASSMSGMGTERGGGSVCRFVREGFLIKAAKRPGPQHLYWLLSSIKELVRRGLSWTRPLVGRWWPCLCDEKYITPLSPEESTAPLSDLGLVPCTKSPVLCHFQNYLA